MSKLISGKEAWIKAVNGESVQYNLGMQWEDLTGRELNYWQGERFLNKDLNYKFRLKPRTINLNGIEVPEIEGIYILSNANNTVKLKCKTNEDALKVKEALRSIFNEKTKEGDPS